VHKLIYIFTVDERHCPCFNGQSIDPGKTKVSENKSENESENKSESYM
jgi:hypothetical protein